MRRTTRTRRHGTSQKTVFASPQTNPRDFREILLRALLPPSHTGLRLSANERSGFTRVKARDRSCAGGEATGCVRSARLALSPVPKPLVPGHLRLSTPGRAPPDAPTQFLCGGFVRRPRCLGAVAFLWLLAQTGANKKGTPAWGEGGGRPTPLKKSVPRTGFEPVLPA